MSAAIPFSTIYAEASLQTVRQETWSYEEQYSDPDPASALEEEQQLVPSLACFRKRTEALLRRYLYASMLVGRAPSLLDHPVARGWASSRPVRTFEEAVNFVLDIE